MTEIGSFIEFEFNMEKEYYSGLNVIRLNSGRSGIFHAARILGCKTVWVPYYQCETVRNFLIKKGISVKYYHIDNLFNPIDLTPAATDAVIVVNYFGIMSLSRLKTLSDKYPNVIIDNSQGFFTAPLDNCMNVYSARKFIGVPDGAYVIGKGVNSVNDYDTDFSSDTADFLLKRIEYGLEGITYAARTKNEERIDCSDVLNMSGLTRAILMSADYEKNKSKRIANFKTACSLFNDINEINPLEYYDESCFPMVYPLVIENDDLLNHLLSHKIFQGHWWKYLLNETEASSFEYYLAKYIIPITIDQRYNDDTLTYTYNLVKGFLEK